MTVDSRKSLSTFTAITVHEVLTDGSVTTRIRLAFVDFDATVGAAETRCTPTQEAVVPVETRRSVGTRMRQAVIDVVLTEIACEAGQTSAFKVVDSINANGTVEAWILRKAVVLV